jgi:hypothetical protein
LLEVDVWVKPLEMVVLIPACQPFRSAVAAVVKLVINVLVKVLLTLFVVLTVVLFK